MTSAQLFPVLKRVPDADRQVGKRTPAQTQSLLARAALKESLQLTGLELSDELAFDKLGAPVPQNGVLWSLTHKPEWVGAVCSPQSLSDLGIGIDIEKIIERKNSRTFDYVADDAEWILAGERTLENFFRLWTAKEAVLKALGTGLRELQDCRLVDFKPRKGDQSHLTLYARQRNWEVLQYYFEGHLVSLTPLGANVDFIFSK